MNSTYSIFEVPADFYSFTVRFPRLLSTDEISRASGCIGYALRETLAGEDLSDPQVGFALCGATVLSFDYDSTKSRRDDPDSLLAFERAAAYIVLGTPIRKTNRAGFGTKGTSLVDGIGLVSMVFSFERPEPTPPAPALALGPPDLVEVLAAREALELARGRYTAAVRNLAAGL